MSKLQDIELCREIIAAAKAVHKANGGKPIYFTCPGVKLKEAIIDTQKNGRRNHNV